MNESHTASSPMTPEVNLLLDLNIKHPLRTITGGIDPRQTPITNRKRSSRVLKA